MNKRSLVWPIFFLIVFTACSTNQNEKVNENKTNSEIALSIDNTNKEDSEGLPNNWPKQRGGWSETKDDTSYIYEGYNFDFGEDLPKYNHMKIIRDIKTDMFQVELMFPVYKDNSQQIDINLAYDPLMKQVSNLKSNKDDINVSSISKQLDIIYKVVNID